MPDSSRKKNDEETEFFDICDLQKSIFKATTKEDVQT